MKKLLFFFITNILCLSGFSQEHAWVFLKDKPNSTSYLNNPLTMLSQRALNRRTTQNIALDEIDVPLEAMYYNQIASFEGVTVLAKSKWLNAIHVLGTQEDINSLLSSFDFIDSIEFANKNIGVSAKSSKVKHQKHQTKFQKTTEDFEYGAAANQIEMLGGDVLHENGFTGKGMHIAVIDAGFPNVNTLDAFSRLRDNNQILGGYDFVDRTEDFYGGDGHGTNVLSDIGGYLEAEFIGTAPDASFYLFRTEDDANETPLEESLWVEAAERADSLGVDVINTSLGYTTFDNSNYDYSYADMNGRTTFISRGAAIGATRGMLLVNSAGNSGNRAWNYIGAPADVANVFSIGAVNGVGEIAVFSSFGPTSDGRVKPDVLAQGQSAFIISENSGAVVTSSGTSFSSPIITGVIACFWQAFPTKTNLEIMQLIRESADRYTNPTGQHGYGIPNFEALFNEVLSSENNSLNNNVNIYPNPVDDILNIDLLNDVKGKVFIYSSLGALVVEKALDNDQLDVSMLSQGVYFVVVEMNNDTYYHKLLKK